MTLSPVNFTYFSRTINIRKKVKELFKAQPPPDPRVAPSSNATFPQSGGPWSGDAPLPPSGHSSGHKATSRKSQPKCNLELNSTLRAELSKAIGKVNNLKLASKLLCTCLAPRALCLHPSSSSPALTTGTALLVPARSLPFSCPLRGHQTHPHCLRAAPPHRTEGERGIDH